MKKIKTAVVGIGFIGVAHIEALRRLGNVDVIAISDPIDVVSKAKNLNIEHAYSDYKKMIDELNLDFIHICAPNNLHYEITEYALNHGVNVVLEKPMTLDVLEAEKLVKLAQEKNLIAAINYHNRMYPAILHIKDQIQKGLLGDVFSVTGSYLQDWLLYQTDFSWRLNRKTSGNTRAVADIGSHWLDLVEFASSQKVIEVFAEFKTVYPQRKRSTTPIETFSNANENTTYELVDIDTEDIAIITFKLANDAIGNVVVNQMVAGKKNRIEFIVSGTKASAEWNLENLSDVIIGYRDQPNQIVTKDKLLMPEASMNIDYPSGHFEGFPDAIKHNFRLIYDKMTNKKSKTLFATFDDGLHQMKLTEAIYESANKKNWVKVGK